jgi:hypothetical protein
VTASPEASSQRLALQWSGWGSAPPYAPYAGLLLLYDIDAQDERSLAVRQQQRDLAIAEDVNRLANFCARQASLGLHHWSSMAVRESALLRSNINSIAVDARLEAARLLFDQRPAPSPIEEAPNSFL